MVLPTDLFEHHRSWKIGEKSVFFNRCLKGGNIFTNNIFKIKYRTNKCDNLSQNVPVNLFTADIGISYNITQMVFFTFAGLY